jgi:hypothetical protein
MPEELLFTVHGTSATPARPLTLAEAGFRERRDLQEWVIAHPEILGPDIMIVTMEFDHWQSSNGKTADRLDILGLHTSGELVVAELKRDRAPDTVEMQAIKYGAMVSRFTIETLAEQQAKFLTQRGRVTDEETAADLLTTHAPDIAVETIRRPRLLLLASEYPPTTIATAVWLREMGIDMTLMQYRAYRTGQEVSISVSQLYPIPSVEDFTISPRQAEVRAVEETRRRRQDVGTVAKIIAAGLLEDGAPLTVRPYGINRDLREPLEAWLDERPERRTATWQSDEKAPLLWGADRQTYTPTGLAKKMLSDTTGIERAIRGGEWWIDEDERTLVQLAAGLESERGAAYVEFKSRLVERIRQAGLDWDTGPLSTNSWINFKASQTGATWEISFGRHRLLRSGLYFYEDRTSFEALRARREEIEHRFGAPLEWEAPEGNKFARVCAHRDGKVTDTDSQDVLIAWIIDTQRRLRSAIDGAPAPLA